jgi:DNA-binding response OmpR family regulator
MDIATSEAEKEENVTESTPRPDSIDPMTHSSAIRGQPAVSRDRILTVGYVTANIDSREVFVSQKPVDLTAKEFDLMVYMMNRPRRVFTRGDLLSAVWGYDFEGDTRTVDVHISRLRQKIDPLIHELAQTHGTDCPESFLETIRGVGYRLVSGANYTAVGKDDTSPKKQGG